MATRTSDPPTVECSFADCTAIGRKWEFVGGEYCSQRCRTRDDGRDALAPLKYDHCRCHTCFSRLKTVNPPKPDFEFTKRGHAWTLGEDGEPTLEYFDQSVTREAACGFQFMTEYAGKGEKQRDDRVITGTICDHCGATDHTDHDPTLAGRRSIGRLATLLGEADDLAIDVHQLHRSYAATADLDLAVGRALSD